MLVRYIAKNMNVDETILELNAFFYVFELLIKLFYSIKS